MTQAQVGHLHRRRPTAQIDGLVAPVELIGFPRGVALRDEYAAGAVALLFDPGFDEALPVG